MIKICYILILLGLKLHLKTGNLFIIIGHLGIGDIQVRINL